jgi:hypothetical protein
MTASIESSGSRPPARPPGGRVPDFLIVGHPKSGTTALHQMLQRHPQVYMPMKEPRFFSPELRSRLSRLGPRQAPESLEDYLRLFAGAAPGQLAGEASPSYLRSHDAPARIAAVAPGARIVTIFREPASFLRSFHLQSVHNHVETAKSFQRAMELEPARRRGKKIPRFSQSPQTLLYSDHIRYTEQLKRFHSHFPREQVLVLIYDDYRADNAATVARVLSFLGLESQEEFVPRQTGTLPGIRSLTLHQLERVVIVARRNPNSSSPLLRAVNKVVPASWHSERLHNAWRKAVYAPPEVPDPGFMAELRRGFQSEVQAFGDYIGRDLITLWGYDRLG